MKVKIYSVEIVKFNIEESKLTIYASGKTNSSDWEKGVLIPFSYKEQPEDGILDFDFVATSPRKKALWTSSVIPSKRVIPLEDWVRGIRIHSSSNSVEAMICNEAQSVGSISLQSGDWPWPW